MKFDRIVLINLDRCVDRLAGFQAKIEEIPFLFEYIRYRAVDGKKVAVPGFFTSGAGAYGCRQSHLRVLEDALMDNITSLLVFEDDVLFCRDFGEKFRDFLRVVPDDWDGLMLGGQDQSPPLDTPVPGVVRAVATQRTHAYAVRGTKAIQALYQLWARADRHIDHLFGEWQCQFKMYQPQPFLCGQDEGKSDISGRTDSIRYWDAATPRDVTGPMYVVTAPRIVIERLRSFGLHYGYCRDQYRGFDKGLMTIADQGWPEDKLTEWANLIAYQAYEKYDTPALWFDPLPDREVLEARMGRPIKWVTAETVQQGIEAIPALLPHWLSADVVWCWRGRGHETLEGLAYHGFHRGFWKDEITGLDNGIRNAIDNDRYPMLKGIVRQLTQEITKVRYGKILLAHPALDVSLVRDELPGANIQELTGSTLKDLMANYRDTLKNIMGMYNRDV